LNYKIIPLAFALVFLLVPPMSSFGEIQTTDVMYTCEVNGNIEKRDKITGDIIFANAPVISGMTGEVGCVGLAEDPTNLGTWYALIQDSQNGGARWLVTVDPDTGVGTAIANMFLNVPRSHGISLAINSTGFIFITEGNQSSFSPDDIVSVNKTTGIATQQCTLGSQSGNASLITWNWITEQFVVLKDGSFNGQGDFDIRVLTDMGASDCGETLPSVSYNNATEYQTNTSNGLLGHGYSWAFHTEDNGFYSMTGDSSVGASPLYSFITSTYSASIINTSPSSTLGFGSGTLQTGQFLKALAFELEEVSSDAVPPVISAIDSEPITILQDTSFDAFEHVQCIDDVDGTIVPNGVFGTDGGITIDTSNRGIQTQDYTCTDDADNTTLATIEYIVKKISTGGSGVSSGGTLSSTPSLSSIPTLSVTDSSTQTGEGQSIADLFASLFDNRITEGITTPSPSVSSGSPAPTQTSNPIVNFFQNLFANFFN